MSRSTSLTCQSKKVCIVIRKNQEISMDKIQEYCKLYFKKYAFICHKGDIDVNGEIIPIHYHIVGDFLADKIPFTTRLNTICEFFGFDNSFGIEIDKYNSLEKSIQYLTHKNNPEKMEHKKEEIITNIESSEFDLLYSAENSDVITFDFLYMLCFENNNIIGVIRAIGLSNYRTWRNVILDIFNNVPRGDNNEKY